MPAFRLPLAAACLALLAGGALAQEPGAHFLENWDLDGSGDVSLAELEERRSDVFAAFDADDNGSLDQSEYATFDQARKNDMESQPGHGKGMAHVMAGLQREANDADGNGEVSHEEFIAHSTAWFAALDRNGDGTITSTDFARP